MNNRKISLITGIITTAVLVGMSLYITFDDGFNPKGLIIVFAALLSGFYSTYRLIKNSYTKSDLVKCEEHYRELLRGVFESEEKAKRRKDIILALYFYNAGGTDLLYSLLKNLKKHCENRYEISLVYLLDAFYNIDMYNYENAIESLNKIISVDSQNADINHLIYLLEYDGESNKEQFFEKLKSALSLDKENPYILNSCANACVQLKNYNEAIEYANKAINTKDSLCQPYSVLSLAYTGLQNYSEAEKYKIQAIQKGADEEMLNIYIENMKNGEEHCSMYDEADVFVYNDFKMKI